MYTVLALVWLVISHTATAIATNDDFFLSLDMIELAIGRYYCCSCWFSSIFSSSVFLFHVCIVPFRICARLNNCYSNLYNRYVFSLKPKANEMIIFCFLASISMDLWHFVAAQTNTHWGYYTYITCIDFDIIRATAVSSMMPSILL